MLFFIFYYFIRYIINTENWNILKIKNKNLTDYTIDIISLSFDDQFSRI